MAIGDAIIATTYVLSDLTTAQKLKLRDFVVSLGVGNPSDIQAVSVRRNENDGAIEVAVMTYADKPFDQCSADELARLKGRR